MAGFDTGGETRCHGPFTAPGHLDGAWAPSALLTAALTAGFRRAKPRLGPDWPNLDGPFDPLEADRYQKGPELAGVAEW